MNTKVKKRIPLTKDEYRKMFPYERRHYCAEMRQLLKSKKRNKERLLDIISRSCGYERIQICLGTLKMSGNICMLAGSVK